LYLKNFALRSVLLGLSCLPFSISASAQIPPDNPKTACLHQVQVASIGELSFKAYKNDKTGDACLQVFRNGKVIFRRTLGNGGSYVLGQEKDENGPYIPDGTDVTGRGHPNMLVSFYTGGAHCCLLYYVFELEPELKLIATLDARDGDFRILGPCGLTRPVPCERSSTRMDRLAYLPLTNQNLHRRLLGRLVNCVQCLFTNVVADCGQPVSLTAAGLTPSI
jgi:hypothetical protein